MLTFSIILFLVACGGFIFSIIQIIKNVIKKQDAKKNIKILMGCLVLAIVAIFIPASPNDTEKTTKVSTQSKEYASKNTSEKTKEDVKKLEEEKKAREAEETKKWNEFLSKNTKELSAGEHIVGTHLDSGTYEISFNGSGNFMVYSKDGTLLSNEVGGTDMGISKYRTVLTDGSKIKISGMSINTKPVKPVLNPYGDVSIYAGYWVVGVDITAGRYKAIPKNGSGNFMIYGRGSVLKTNEILGGELGVNEVVVNLEDDDIINISGLNEITLTPSK